MIESKVAAAQLERLTGLDFFPKEAPAKKELRLAIECAITEAIAIQVISDWLGESNLCPKPAELRRLIYARQEGLQEQRRKCGICGGTGMVTAWKLVTYKGNSFTVARTRTLDMDFEAVREFSNNLAAAEKENPTLERQTVLSAAKDCACRAV